MSTLTTVIATACAILLHAGSALSQPPPAVDWRELPARYMMSMEDFDRLRAAADQYLSGDRTGIVLHGTNRLRGYIDGVLDALMHQPLAYNCAPHLKSNPDLLLDRIARGGASILPDPTPLSITQSAILASCIGDSAAR